MTTQDVRNVPEVVIIVVGAFALARLDRGLRGHRAVLASRPGGPLAPRRAARRKAFRSGPAAVSGLGPLVWLPRFTRRRRSGPDTTNSSAENPATAIPDHTFGENTNPVAKSPIATPIFQNISIAPVR